MAWKIQSPELKIQIEKGIRNLKDRLRIDRIGKRLGRGHLMWLIQVTEKGTNGRDVVIKDIFLKLLS